MVYRLVYSSKANNPFSDNDIELLLNKSQKNNEVNSITGLLMYIDSDFLQVLEGNKANVISLYDKLAKDERHNSVRVVFQDYVEARQFPDWSMGFHKLSYYELKKSKLFKDITKLSLTNIHDDLTVMFIDELVKHHSSDFKSTVKGFVKNIIS